MNGWRLNAQIDRMTAEHAAAAARANQEALERYTAMERTKQEALDEANRIAQINSRAAAAARAESDRLRQQVATADSVSTATVASLRAYTTTLGTVFRECVATVEELAAKADGHALDSRTLNGAWPK
jgi:hypothetical protein